MALAGADGRRAEELLRGSVRAGAAALGELTAAAARRLLRRGGDAVHAPHLFTDDERAELARALAATNATAELLGRARIRKRLEQAQQYDDRAVPFSDLATDFSVFDDAPVRPLAPARAYEYFRALVPSLNLDPLRWGEAQERDAFTLAGATDRLLLRRVKGLVLRALGTGERVRDTPRDVEALLDAAGVSPRNPQYAEMAFRTNMMDAFNTGATKELQHPDVRDWFPAWKYLGIKDGRQGKDHEPHFDRYFPNAVAFATVRGPRVWNCRCCAAPVDKNEWAALRARGVGFSAFAEGPLDEEG